MIFVFKCFSFLPLWLAHLIGSLLGWLVFALSPSYRNRFLQNSQQAGYSFAAVKGAIPSAGRMVAELPKLWMGTKGKSEGKAEAPFQCNDFGVIEQAYAAGKGVIFLTPHLGCFEMIGQAWAQTFGAHHGPFTVLFRPARKAWMSDLVANSRNRFGLATVPTNLAGVRQMIKALRKGQAVGLLPDQVPPDGMGVWVPFFDKDAYSMTLAARLHAQTGATVLVGWGERLPWGRGFVLHFRTLHTDWSDDINTAVKQMNTEMENLIRSCPTQFLWGYGRYKTPRKENQTAEMLKE
ncbi:MAG TPA: lysophospholipid acyltransferase family protein [Burkholderiaceae bacterium]|nr:lysophospholipid acyltransferase family protein [Burkholderiaceae bacterium]